MQELRWENELERILITGTNHQAGRNLQSLNLTYRVSHLHIARAPDKELLAKSADQNRRFINRLPCLAGLPREEMQKDLPWMNESAWLQAPEQLSRDSLWQYMCWGARFHHPDRDSEEVLHNQMCRMAGYFGIIDSDGLRSLRDRYQNRKDSDGWYSPLPSSEGRIVCLNTGSSTTDKRILCTVDKDSAWGSWGLGEQNPQYHNLRCTPLGKGQGLRELSDHITEHMQTSRRWYHSKKLYLDHLGSTPTPYGVRTHDPHLNGVFRLGDTEKLIKQVIHGRAPQPKDWHQRTLDTTLQDYDNPAALQHRAREYGIDPEDQGLREKIAARSLQEHGYSEAAWSRPLNSCQRGSYLEDCHTGKLEAIVCQSLPSGLIHPGLPGQPTRLHGTLAASVIYRPVNPYVADQPAS
jgi:hypothetical protein